VISRLSGRHRAIGEYLAENVPDSLEPHMLDFLMATSLTERISGDLASALAGVGNGQVLLEEAEHRDLFPRRLDEDGEWFRYHQLFAEFLQRRLERDHPERITRLHAIASRWVAEPTIAAYRFNADQPERVDALDRDFLAYLTTWNLGDGHHARWDAEYLVVTATKRWYAFIERGMRPRG
jgi:ATP/maltotriose-dependent transcriptional regulator MalT